MLTSTQICWLNHLTTTTTVEANPTVGQPARSSASRNLQTPKGRIDAEVIEFNDFVSVVHSVAACLLKLCNINNNGTYMIANFSPSKPKQYPSNAKIIALVKSKYFQ